jgi:hypothetical protein
VLIPADVRPENDRLENVLAPLIVDVVVVPVKDTLLNVLLPPEKVTAPFERLIWDVPALNVKLDRSAAELLREKPLLDRSIVLDPKFMDRVFAFTELISVPAKLKVERSIEPFVTVKLESPASADPKAHPQPTPFTVVADEIDTPLVVNVLPVADPVSVIAPV